MPTDPRISTNKDEVENKGALQDDVLNTTLAKCTETQQSTSKGEKRKTDNRKDEGQPKKKCKQQSSSSKSKTPAIKKIKEESALNNEISTESSFNKSPTQACHLMAEMMKTSPQKTVAHSSLGSVDQDGAKPSKCDDDDDHVPSRPIALAEDPVDECSRSLESWHVNDKTEINKNLKAEGGTNKESAKKTNTETSGIETNKEASAMDTNKEASETNKEASGSETNKQLATTETNKGPIATAFKLPVGLGGVVKDSNKDKEQKNNKMDEDEAGEDDEETYSSDSSEEEVELTMTERQDFMTNVMSNLPSNMFYNTFCFSIPKSREMEIMYAFFAKDVENLTKRKIAPKCRTEPSKESIDRADRIVVDIRERYCQTPEKSENTNKAAESADNQEKQVLENKEEVSEAEEKNVPETQRKNIHPDKNEEKQSSNQIEKQDNNSDKGSGESSSSERLQKEVDNDIPRSTVLVLSDTMTCLKLCYPGQCNAFVDPVSNTLSVDVFSFLPIYSKQFYTSMAKDNISKNLLAEILDNMERFEMARQFRMEMSLIDITVSHLYTSKADTFPAVLRLTVGHEPLFMQRWINTSASSRNLWHRRQNFLPFESLESPPFTICLSGRGIEMSDIAALITRAKTDLVKDVGECEMAKSDVEVAPEHSSGYIPENDSNTQLHGFVDEEVTRRRDTILDVLGEHKIISSSVAKECKIALIGCDDFDDAAHNTNKEKVLNDLVDVNLPLCLKDFVCYKCTNAEMLDQILATPLLKTSLLMSDDRVCPAPAIGTASLTVSDLVKMEYVFFSYCKQKLLLKSEYQHCACCKTCTRSRVTRTDTLVPRTVCNTCGFVGESAFVIQPLSHRRNGGSHFVMKERNIKECINDVLVLPDPCRGLKASARPKKVFNLDDAMDDVLGLNDPVAFLLGSKSRGKESMQGRCRQKYLKKNQCKTIGEMMAILTGVDMSAIPKPPPDAKPAPPMCSVQ